MNLILRLPMTNNHINEIIKCTNSCEYFIKTYITIHLSKEDIEFIKSLEYGNYHIIASPENSHNTLLMHLMIMWKMLFKSSDSVYLIMTSKMTHTHDYINRFKTYYNMLPEWMKIDIKRDSARYIILSNGNILSTGIYSPDSIIGFNPMKIS